MRGGCREEEGLMYSYKEVQVLETSSSKWCSGGRCLLLHKGRRPITYGHGRNKALSLWLAEFRPLGSASWWHVGDCYYESLKDPQPRPGKLCDFQGLLTKTKRLTTEQSLEALTATSGMCLLPGLYDSPELRLSRSRKFHSLLPHSTGG
jgi:hypothetical protein